MLPQHMAVPTLTASLKGFGRAPSCRPAALLGLLPAPCWSWGVSCHRLGWLCDLGQGSLVLQYSVIVQLASSGAGCLHPAVAEGDCTERGTLANINCEIFWFLTLGKGKKNTYFIKAAVDLVSVLKYLKYYYFCSEK